MLTIFICKGSAKTLIAESSTIRILLHRSTRQMPGWITILEPINLIDEQAASTIVKKQLKWLENQDRRTGQWERVVVDSTAVKANASHLHFDALVCVVKQAHQRVFKGKVPKSTEKWLSTKDRDAAIIAKGQREVHKSGNSCLFLFLGLFRIHRFVTKKVFELNDGSANISDSSHDRVFPIHSIFQHRRNLRGSRHQSIDGSAVGET